MLFAKTFGATTAGVDGIIIDVEIDVANGLPSFDIVGLPDMAVKESKERVRTAIKNSGIKLRQEKVTINLAPADIRKDSSGLDLPIAAGLLTAYGVIPDTGNAETLFTAELSLEGELRPVHGVLSMVLQARDRGIKRVFTAPQNKNEALLVQGITVYAPASLTELVAMLTEKQELQAAVPEVSQGEGLISPDDFADVQGQFVAKRALEIAAAGGHNTLMVGSPGAGKTMLARRVSSILPPMTLEESLEVTKIYSIAGLLQGGGMVTQRPFRSPHHTASTIAMIGGGSTPRPGEVTLAHNGVLFLDELPEFSKKTLEVLRQPLEDSLVTISRVHATMSFPARVLLICALNPCPCGFLGDPEHECSCSRAEIKRYLRKISGPFLDRIDIQIRVPRVKYQELVAKERAESSAAIRQRVLAARERQLARFRGRHIFCNAQMNHALLQKTCTLTKGAQQILEQAFRTMGLSARSYDRLIKVAQTIADLAEAKEINEQHVAEAIQLRNDVRQLADEY